MVGRSALENLKIPKPAARAALVIVNGSRGVIGLNVDSNMATVEKVCPKERERR